jgi:hypothetical protein
VTRLLDIWGMGYDTIAPAQLAPEILYGQDGRAMYSVIVDNGNQLTSRQARLVLDAVTNHSIGLVAHTISLEYLGEVLHLQTIEGGEWAEGHYTGDFSLNQTGHYITSTLYNPYENQTHNFGGHLPKEGARFQATQRQNGFTGTVLGIAMYHQDPAEDQKLGERYPEIVASLTGRVVWFARPFTSYELATYTMSEHDKSLTPLVTRAIEWAYQCSGECEKVH